MTWRLAKSLVTLRDQINAAYPNRSKSDDGTIGDVRHAATTSDHNPNQAGVVRAIDVTHDPRHGFDSYAFADFLRTHHDRRIRYIISNSRIAGGVEYVAANGGKVWTWARYTGANAHDYHVHISVAKDSARYDDPAPWNIGQAMPGNLDAPTKDDHPLLRKGDTGAMVERVQQLLHITVDSQFGPVMEDAVREYQKVHGLVPDGIVGGYTWRSLEASPIGPPTVHTFTASGRGSWYSQYDGKYRWRDSGDAPNSSALGVPDDAQGISFFSSATLGKWFEVEAPNGKRSIEQQTDIGPAPATGRLIDISAAAAERFGYSPNNFPTDGVFKWRPIDPPDNVAGLSPREQANHYRDMRATA